MLTILNPDNATRLGMLDLKAFAEGQTFESKRDLEKKATIFLLKQMLGGGLVLCYSQAGKPYLDGRDEHISISHSHDRLVILVHDSQSAGVDIELIREKVKNVQHKFLNPEELLFADNDTEKLITLWAAKESIYKAYGLKEVDFREHMRIEPYGEEENYFFGSIDLPTFKKRYLLSRSKTDNYILVYILREV